MLPYKKEYKSNAQQLRKNMTPEEKHLWYDFLKKLPISVKRQKSLENYIVDFYIPSAKIVIEIDGSQHYEPDNRALDMERDKNLSEWGIKVLRYTNSDINDRFESVVTDILNKLELKFTDLKISR